MWKFVFYMKFFTCEKLQQPIEKAWYTWNLYDFIYEQYAKMKNQRLNNDFADPHIQMHTVTDGLMSWAQTASLHLQLNAEV